MPTACPEPAEGRKTLINQAFFARPGRGVLQYAPTKGTQKIFKKTPYPLDAALCMLYIIISKTEKGGEMKIQIRNVSEIENEAANVAAARKHLSLNQWYLDALRAAVLRAAQRDPAVAIVIESTKPARS